MTTSNYSHQLKKHQVLDLEEMANDLDTLSDIGHTIWHALKSECGEASITGAQYDLANRTYELTQKLKAYAAERRAETDFFDEFGGDDNG